MNHKLLSTFVVGILSGEARGMDFDGFSAPSGPQRDPLEVAAELAQTITDGLGTVAAGLGTAAGVIASVASGVYSALPSSVRVQEAASATVTGVHAYVVTPARDLVGAAGDIVSGLSSWADRQVDTTVKRWDIQEAFLDEIAAVPVKDQPRTRLAEDGWEDVVAPTAKPSGPEGDDDDSGDDASSEDLRSSRELKKAPPKPDVELGVLTKGAPPPPEKDPNPFSDD